MTRGRHSTAALLVAVVLVVAMTAIFTVWRSGMRTENPEVTDPTGAELLDFAGARVFFGHQSVGSNVLSALESMGATGGVALKVVESTASVPAEGGVVVHAHVGVNGDPRGKLEAFAEMIDAGVAGAIDVALVKLCYVDITADQDVDAVFDEYVRTVGELQRRHPEITFLYATVPLVTDRDLKRVVKSWFGRDAGMGPEDNLARQHFNAAMRDRLGESGLLFDIAEVEAAMDQAPTERAIGGETYYVLHDAFSADPGHLNELGARAAAAELVRVVAALER